MDPNQEIEVFVRLAVAMGEPLEVVYRMMEDERNQLINLLLGPGRKHAKVQQPVQLDVHQVNLYLISAGLLLLGDIFPTRADIEVNHANIVLGQSEIF